MISAIAITPRGGREPGTALSVHRAAH